ncbi:MAG: hypothetical protein GX950_03510 [Candidatus Diapherotrites archaeon]|jgi:hypothetical protein|uniref:Uncharacterized protein n=1 Tax=Candidatus Iainarchaeum sp. TaxID=3101447 RepID=A0A7K4C0K1_9ARCH|nr:hypothetical protein [Candidatus Diapherotrites archaeon]
MKRGFLNGLPLIPTVILIMLTLIIILPVGMSLFEPLNILVRIILVFVIFTTVRNYLGPGVISIIISGILIYYLVIKWWWVGAMGWWGITLLGMGIFGVIVWGSSKIIPQRY